MPSSLKLSLLIFFIAILGLGASCGDDVNIPKELAVGKVDGEDWAFKFGNTTPYSGGQTSKFTFRLLSTEERGDDPCPIVSTSNPHIRFILPLGEGSYSIPFADFNETVKFDMGDGTVLSANSGFIEIFGGDLNEIVGYIQAVIDEDNTIEGRFVVELC